MTDIINIADLPIDPNDPDSPTWREHNAKMTHSIPLGSLVEVKYDTWFGDGACVKVHARLWVVSHNRDCDGTPLYSLSDKKIEDIMHLAEYFGTGSYDQFARVYEHGFSESSLTAVESTSELKRGANALCWEDSK